MLQTFVYVYICTIWFFFFFFLSDLHRQHSWLKSYCYERCLMLVKTFLFFFFISFFYDHFLLILNALVCSSCSRPVVFYKKSILKNFQKFTRKHLCQSLFFNKVADLRLVTLLKKRLWHRFFPVNFAKFLRNTSGGCFWCS